MCFFKIYLICVNYLLWFWNVFSVLWFYQYFNISCSSTGWSIIKSDFEKPVKTHYTILTNIIWKSGKISNFLQRFSYMLLFFNVLFKTPSVLLSQRAECWELLSMVNLTWSMFSGVRTVVVLQFSSFHSRCIKVPNPLFKSHSHMVLANSDYRWSGCGKHDMLAGMIIDVDKKFRWDTHNAVMSSAPFWLNSILLQTTLLDYRISNCLLLCLSHYYQNTVSNLFILNMFVLSNRSNIIVYKSYTLDTFQWSKYISINFNCICDLITFLVHHGCNILTRGLNWNRFR